MGWGSSMRRRGGQKVRPQGRILAKWILAAKLPNSDLNFAVDFLVDFFLLLFPRKKARKVPPKNPPQNSPRTLFGKIPLGFLQKPFLDSSPPSKVCLPCVWKGGTWDVPDLWGCSKSLCKKKVPSGEVGLAKFM